MKYLIKTRNPKTGKVEMYVTETKSPDEFQLFLDFWKNDAGYDIISFVEEGAETNADQNREAAVESLA